MEIVQVIWSNNLRFFEVMYLASNLEVIFFHSTYYVEFYLKTRFYILGRILSYLILEGTQVDSYITALVRQLFFNCSPSLPLSLCIPPKGPI